MPRPAGSKNKHKSKRRDAFTVALHKVLPATTVKKVIDLSVKSNIELRRVLDDAVLEGAAELETEAYASLILFNARRGKVVHESHAEVPPESQRGASPEEQYTGSGEDRFNDADVRPGLRTSNLEDTGVPKRGIDEEQIRQTAEHLANHPPFTSDGFVVSNSPVPEESPSV